MLKSNRKLNSQKKLVIICSNDIQSRIAYIILEIPHIRVLPVDIYIHLKNTPEPIFIETYIRVIIFKDLLKAFIECH